MTSRYRIPRRVYLGKGYFIKVLVASQQIIREAIDDDEGGDILYGLFVAEYGWPCFGTIYLWNKLNKKLRWETYWHELLHGVNDLTAWDRDHPLAT